MEKNMNLESLLDVVKADDLEFYERFVQNLNEEEFENFMKDNPDFFSDIAGR